MCVQNIVLVVFEKNVLRNVPYFKFQSFFGKSAYSKSAKIQLKTVKKTTTYINIEFDDENVSFFIHFSFIFHSFYTFFEPIRK